eukprot:CAMPEP_0119101994 /NCGR_PEP_ID=MMETSP1180-20130426/886_1 /TAXON_ID=3052 ORGANISM="Chlamydomonas cf sp, Strain CCMP681" /NCGR_SAMPLE_ID=MMETSP1180 /ASSEMBLY_ACC=CAM_ASM_000741 /LENGTH=108 /DNA_ID=CAMNT_0007086199 /DNA_START=209 /DNA_END=536 /DNA_ORIENTATION=-
MGGGAGGGCTRGGSGACTDFTAGAWATWAAAAAVVLVMGGEAHGQQAWPAALQPEQRPAECLPELVQQCYEPRPAVPVWPAAVGPEKCIWPPSAAAERAQPPDRHHAP